MSIDLKTVNKLARLSAMKFDEETATEIAGDLNKIVDFISQLQEVQTEGVEPMSSTVDTTITPEREDKVTAINDRESLMSTSPKQEMGFFVVPRVIE
ncbi:MAG: aspartyl-tRNA(Asn)/glutamyl-tRNA(Gln) amidotransferase subunit C [Alphaproteobacteria bacterium]|jgi:aspartyl-tRNA(Asn)/glutamyl-tRNA(Gln) amidotransferase subunit C